MKRLLLAACAALLLAAPALGQSASNMTHVLSQATTNSTLITGINPARLYSITAINTTSTVYYLKFYDKSTAPTCNSDRVALTYPIPHASGNGAGFTISIPFGFQFNNGIGICITGAIADDDNTAAATGVAIDIGWK